ETMSAAAVGTRPACRMIRAPMTMALAHSAADPRIWGLVGKLGWARVPGRVVMVSLSALPRAGLAVGAEVAEADAGDAAPRLIPAQGDELHVPRIEDVDDVPRHPL